MDRVAEMGVTADRGKTVEEIADVLDLAQRGVSRQLGVAATRGWVEKRADGRWYVLDEKS